MVDKYREGECRYNCIANIGLVSLLLVCCALVLLIREILTKFGSVSVLPIPIVQDQKQQS